MKGLYRGFCRNENGAETIVLNGEKIKGDWVYGGLYVNSRIYDIKADHFIITTIDGFGMIEPPMAKPIEVIPETVCEAVRGLTDRNGKQVFEGDMVFVARPFSFSYEGYIVFDKHRFCVNVGGNLFGFENDNRITVHGTIFDEQFAEGV